MKKLIAGLLSLTMVFALCACGGLDKLSELPPLPTFTPTPEGNVQTAPSAPAPTPTEEPKVETPQANTIVEIVNTEQKAYDPQYGETLILTFAYETPVVLLEGRPEAQQTINEFIALLNETYVTGEDYGEGYGTGYMNMLTEAEDNYNYMVNEGIEGASLEFSCIRTVSVERGDDNVLSLKYTDNSYTGGAHGMYDYTGYNFDAKTGDILSLDNISNDSAAFKSFLAAYMLNLAQTEADIAERIDLVDRELDSALAALLRDGSWFFSQDGLHIFSSLYEISSYASGIIDFVIPYDQLAAYVKPEYLPVDITAQGSISAEFTADAAESDTVFVGLVKTDDIGEQLYIEVSGSVQNVRVSNVVYFGNSFYETGLLWYCGYMNDCALQLQTDIPDGMPKIMISYDTAEGQSRKLLTQSGDDGHLILIDDTVMAVG